MFSASDRFGQRSDFGEDDVDEDEDESDDKGEEDNCGGGAFLAVIFCSCFAVMIVMRALESIDCICRFRVMDRKAQVFLTSTVAVRLESLQTRLVLRKKKPTVDWAYLSDSSLWALEASRNMPKRLFRDDYTW